MMGLTHNYHPERLGFFLLPADQRSNNERCFVVAAATDEVSSYFECSSMRPGPPCRLCRSSSCSTSWVRMVRAML